MSEAAPSAISSGPAQQEADALAGDGGGAQSRPSNLTIRQPFEGLARRGSAGSPVLRPSDRDGRAARDTRTYLVAIPCTPGGRRVECVVTEHAQVRSGLGRSALSAQIVRRGLF